MPHGGRLTISAAPGPTRPSNGSGDVSVEFRDTGIGIPAENLDRVFDPFFTTKGALGEAGLTGLGLGLSIAHSIVTAHGGMLGAESREGEGSTFTMWLPLSPAPLEEAAPAAPDGPTEQLPPLRILVADDEPAVREGLAELLRVQGHTVVEVADGQQALEALSRNDIDLALVDLLMPTLNGRDLLDAFDGSPPCPVVVITGRGAETDADALVARGASSLLIKPFQIRALNAALEQAYYAR
jgi:two-component system cell cycle sensor histidine kinase/response regulator CckA